MLVECTHVGVTYIDDNLTARMSSLYLAIFFVMGPAGSAVGYVLGGYFASLYTDFDRVDSSEWVTIKGLCDSPNKLHMAHIVIDFMNAASQVILTLYVYCSGIMVLLFTAWRLTRTARLGWAPGGSVHSSLPVSVSWYLSQCWAFQGAFQVLAQ